MMKGIVIAVLAMALLAPVSQAALEIISFTCNNMATEANVQASESLNCDAVIQNTDSQNAAGVSSVKLYSVGGWSDSESYSGAGFLTSISAGGTTTATFSNIISASPGNSHKFLHIDIDSTAHTEEVSDLTINSIAFKSFSVSASTSLTASGNEFTVNAYLTAGGSISSATVTASLSGGCELGAGETAAKSLGSLSNNVEASAIWRVSQGSSTCTVSLTATGTSSPATTTKTKAISVSSTATTSSPSSAGGGGGGGGGGAVSSKETYIGQLVLNEEKTIDAVSGETVKFSLGRENHSITIVEITQSSATLKVESEPVVIQIQAGETKKLDLDKDGTLDLSITLNSINLKEKKISLSVKAVSEKLDIGPGAVPKGGICAPGEKRCDGDSLSVCRTDGVGWDSTKCADSCDPVNLKCKGYSEAQPVKGLLYPSIGYGFLVAALALFLAGSWVHLKGGKKQKKLVKIFIAASVSMLLLYLLLAAGLLSNITGFATQKYSDCLREKNVTLYGASWCAECREQISLLGDNLADSGYIDCKSDFDSCLQAGIREIPAWKIQGKLHTGKMTMEEVIGLAGC